MYANMYTRKKEEVENKMTSFEKDYKAALEGDEIEVLTRRKKEIEDLEKK